MVTRDPIPFITLHMNWQASGWSERHYLPMLSWDQAAALGNFICRWRIAACCSGAKLIWARLAFTDRPNFTEPLRCIGLTSDGFRGVGRNVPEDPFMRLHYRYETATGHWNTRLFGGIPDAVVTEMRTTQVYLPWPAGDDLPDLDDQATRWADVFRGMLRVIRDNTVYCRPVKNTDPPAHNYETWHAVVWRKVANRNTGRDFLRVSWESARSKPAGDPGVDPPWHAAPHFTPCGAAVGVVRSAYQRPCIWYRNGPLGRIRFYFVPESNPILWYRTVFWPYSQDLTIVNVAKPGEQTNSPRRWDRGDDFLGLDGTHPTGTAQDYAGETDVPWSPAVPTPLQFLPRCNFAWLDVDAGGVEVSGWAEIGPPTSGGVEVSGAGVLEVVNTWSGVEVGGVAEVGPPTSGGVEVSGAGVLEVVNTWSGVEVGGVAEVGPPTSGGVEVSGGNLGIDLVGGGGVEVSGFYVLGPTASGGVVVSGVAGVEFDTPPDPIGGVMLGGEAELS